MNRGGATGGQSEDVMPDGADGLNPTVKLVFDKFTPRPHFIVLKNQATVADNAPQLYDQTFTLVTEFLRRKPEYAANAILSFHRGSWYQQHSNVWHCHLCVPLAPYRAAANAVRGRLSPNYMTTLDGFSGKTQTKYDRFRTDTANKAGTVPPIAVQLPASADFELAWMRNEPRLAVCLRGAQARTLRQLYDFFITTENVLRGRINQYGSHFCLYVSGQGNPNTTPRPASIFDASGAETNVQIVGYVQLGSTDYYQVLPENFKAPWLQVFRDNRRYTVET